MGSEAGAIGERVARLERENRHLRVLGVVSLVGVAAVLACQGRLGRGGGEVAAERFVVKDRSGRVQAEMGVREGEGPHVSLYDGMGREFVSLRGAGDGEALLTFSERGRDRIAIRSGEHGATLSFVDREHGNAAGFYMTDGGEQGFGLRGSKGQLHLSIDREGTAGLAFRDRDGRPLGGLGLAADGSPEWKGAGRAGRSVLEGSRRNVSLRRVPLCLFCGIEVMSSGGTVLDLTEGGP